MSYQLAFFEHSITFPVSPHTYKDTRSSQRVRHSQACLALWSTSFHWGCSSCRLFHAIT